MWGYLNFFLNFKKLINFYFWLCWVFVATCGLSLVVLSRGYSLLRGPGFSLPWLLLLQSTGSRRSSSVIVVPGLSCPAAYVIFPGPRIKPMPLALAGRFLTTRPPEKALYVRLLIPIFSNTCFGQFIFDNWMGLKLYLTVLLCVSLIDTGIWVCLHMLIGCKDCNPLQYSCLENPMDRWASRATVHGVAKN